MRKYQKNAEQVSGSYSVLPHAVMDSTAFMGASHHARSMLFELIRQHNGYNNGHFHLACGWLQGRGWSSREMAQKVKKELQVRQLVIKTRLGGLNAGPDLWAVTWLPISDYAGLTEVSAKTYHPGAWHFLNQPVPIPKRDERTVGRDSQYRQTEQCSTVRRNSAPLKNPLAVPPDGTKTVLLDPLTVPSGGNNVVASSLGMFSAARIAAAKTGHTNKTPATTTRVYRLVNSTLPRFSYAERKRTCS